MKLIVITTPQIFEGEAAAVTSLIPKRFEILHLRKPGASAEEMEYFLNSCRWNICRALSRMSNSSWHPFSV